MQRLLFSRFCGNGNFTPGSDFVGPREGGGGAVSTATSGIAASRASTGAEVLPLPAPPPLPASPLLFELPPLARVPPELEFPPAAPIAPLPEAPPPPFPALLVWPPWFDVSAVALLPPLPTLPPLPLCLVAPPMLPPGAEASGPLLAAVESGGVSLHDSAARTAMASTLQMGTRLRCIRVQPVMSC